MTNDTGSNGPARDDDAPLSGYQRYLEAAYNPGYRLAPRRCWYLTEHLLLVASLIGLGAVIAAIIIGAP